MRAVLVDKTGAVLTAIELAPNWDQPDAGRNAWQPPDGAVVVPSHEAGAGWMWDGKGFTPPPAGPDTDPNAPPPPRDLAAELDALKAVLVAKSVITEAEASVSQEKP